MADEVQVFGLHGLVVPQILQVGAPCVVSAQGASGMRSPQRIDEVDFPGVCETLRYDALAPFSFRLRHCSSIAWRTQPG